jgi:hypothetical protein
MHVLPPLKNWKPRIFGNKTATSTADTDTTAPSTPLNPVNSERITYPFVDLIRFISTIGIVFIHAEFFVPTNEVAFYHKVNHIEWYFFMRQIFKFATICYFLIAGFLLADKIEGNARFKYFMRRLRVIAKPYVFAATLFIIVFLLINAANQKVNLPFVVETIKYVLGYTSFWYVPNYLICLLVIVLFSRYNKYAWFGGLLFLATMGYTYFTVYSVSHTSSHTTALFGFVFYMWLGIYIKKNGIIQKIQQINPVLLIGITVLIFALSNYETWYLFNFTHTRDSLNTLRITNQLYSVAVFALLVRLCGAKAPGFGIFRPKQETYGIYLYHCFFIFYIIPGFEKWLSNYYHFSFFSYNVAKLIAINLFNFVLCYFATTFLVKLLIKYKLAFLPYE